MEIFNIHDASEAAKHIQFSYTHTTNITQYVLHMKIQSVSLQCFQCNDTDIRYFCIQYLGMVSDERDRFVVNAFATTQTHTHTQRDTRSVKEIPTSFSGWETASSTA